MPYGYCHRNAPTQGPLAWVRPEVDADATCGEWADGNITSEQEERRELVRRFALAIVGTEYAGDLVAEWIWKFASTLADMEPK